MPTVALNGHTAQGLKCPPGSKEIVYWSDELPGFGLRCRASGSRSWYVQYRTKAGDMRKHTLGGPPSGEGDKRKGMPFAKAQKEAERLLAAAKLGGDPAGDARKVKNATSGHELVDNYLAHQKPRMKPRSYAELQRHLEIHAKALHGRKAGQVTQRDVVELLQGLTPTAPVTANRVRASLSAMFAWGMKAGLVSANPVAATFKPTEERPRERVLTDDELALIWSCTSGKGDYDRIVRLLLLTGARREEIAAMRRSEATVHSDGTATWALPSERTKNHLPHELVLPSMAAALLPGLATNTDAAPRELLFGESRGPFSGWSRCKERLDSRIAKQNGGKAIPPWVLHDLRRTFVTRLNDLGVEPHVVEALVNHATGLAKAGIAGVYNRSAYSAQKRAALALWCDHIIEIAGIAQTNDDGRVVPLRRPC
jgi:integrase